MLKKITLGSTKQTSIPLRLGQITRKKPRLLKINDGSVEKNSYIIKNATRLNEGIASKNKIYINAHLKKKLENNKKYYNYVR